VSLTEAIQHLRRKPEARHEQIWRATLSREQSAFLHDSKIAAALEKLADKQDWGEHVVIGAPFGILALDNAARAMWLQLEPADRLADLAEMAATQNWDVETVQQVLSGKKLIDLELHLALGDNHKPRPQEAFIIGSGVAYLHAALFDISEMFCPLASDSYQNFTARQSHRQVRD
jgi:hypothetical protein